jgi:hypothetical protein
MRKAKQPVLLVIVALLVATLACMGGGGGGGEAEPQNLDAQLSDYHASLVEEADWMLVNMEYAADPGYTYPDPSRCEDPGFQHPDVTMSRQEKKDDPEAAQLLEYLQTSERLLDETREKWDSHCGQWSSASDTRQFINPRLRNTLDYLDAIESTLEYRASPPEDGDGGGGGIM